MFSSMLGPMMLRVNDSVTRQQVSPGTARRILPYGIKYRWMLTLLLGTTIIDSVIMAATPLMLGWVIDSGINHRRLAVVVGLSLAIAVAALADAFAVYLQTWSSARVGQGLVYDLRAEVFAHVQSQPLAFFARTQTGSLVSRLNTDTVGAQEAVVSLLSASVSTFFTLLLVFAALFYLSWQVTVAALVMIPLFVIPGKVIGKRLQRLTRERMQLEAEIGSISNERFNVAGAMLAKLYGRPDEEAQLFADRAARVRDVGIAANVYGRVFLIIAGLLASLVIALVYGFGGALVINGTLQVGTLVAMVALLMRLYSPINQISNMQVNVMTALVSFDRIFELLDLKPLIAEQPAAYTFPAGAWSNGSAPDVEFEQVWFRYPRANEVSLASLELIGPPEQKRNNGWILRDVSFRAAAGQLTALVGPSGAGKTTVSYLVSRLYDPSSGIVRVGGRDVRDLTMRSLHDMVGTVTQDAYLFHDTIRANLLYARPDATESDIIEVCQAAQIWNLISSFPGGLDTVVGDRGYRLSGGEKQRISLARLLLKAPPVIVLDEATAHLDSESELAIQRALKQVLTGRTSLVIAHRLSTVREADQILVIDDCGVKESGSHEELLATDGLYTALYRTQFAHPLETGDDHDTNSMIN